ncbi:MAG: DUF305 domain-containing protein [Oceanococcaceae bacterium]
MARSRTLRLESAPAMWRAGILLLTLALLACAIVAWAQFEARARSDAARAQQQPGPIDIGFAQAMSRHHQQAIGMAQLLLDGEPSPLRTLATMVNRVQLMELGMMRGWLTLWGEPLVTNRTSMDWMRMGPTAPDAALQQYLLDCEQSPTGMPGLATAEQMEQLRQSTGRARDALFLDLMRAHHEGGLPMANFAARHARLPVVRALATQVAYEQTRELHWIQRTQHAMNASAPSATP